MKSPVAFMFSFNKKGGESIAPTLPSGWIQSQNRFLPKPFDTSFPSTHSATCLQAPVVQTKHLRASAAPCRATWCARRDVVYFGSIPGPQKVKGQINIKSETVNLFILRVPFFSLPHQWDQWEWCIPPNRLQVITVPAAPSSSRQREN